LISIGYETNYLSSQWTVNTNNISSNISYQDYKTNPYLRYKFANKSEFLNESSGNQKHIINYGGTYVSENNFDSLLLSSNAYAIIPNDDWNACKNLTISTWFKSVDAQTSDVFFNNTTNLEVWYKFDGNITNMLLDSSGKGRSLTNNGATIDNTNYRTGSGSVYLNGSSQYLDIDSSINPYTFWNGGNGIAFAFWFKLSNLTGDNARIFDISDGTTGNPVNSLFVSRKGTNNGLRFGIVVNTQESYYDTQVPYIDNIWHHAVWNISSSGDWSIYIDDILLSKLTATYSLTAGNGGNTNGGQFPGGGGAGGVDITRINGFSGTITPTSIAIQGGSANGGMGGSGGNGFGAGGGGGGHWYSVGWLSGGSGANGFVYIIGPNTNAEIFAQSNTTYTIPISGNYTAILMGGGGGGGYYNTTQGTQNAGGGAGFLTMVRFYAINGTVVTITVGSGGGSNTNGNSSTISVSNITYTALGGIHGGSSTKGGSGSSSGGRGYYDALGVSSGYNQGNGSTDSNSMGNAAFNAIINANLNIGVTTIIPNATWGRRYIGRSAFSANGWYVGNIDDFRIYNRVLTPAEVDTLYRVPQNSLKLLEFGDTFYDDNTNLVSWYKFDGNGNDMLTDSSGNGYHLINNGGSIFDNGNYRLGNGSVYFNGSSQYLDFPASINPYTIWNNGNGITFACWFKMSTSSGTWARIFDFADNAINAFGSNWITISRNGTGTTLYLEININSSKTNFATAISYISNNWHHVVWSISSSGTWSIWIDSVPQILSGTGATGTLTGTYPKMLPNVTWTKRYIGRSGNGTGDGWYVGNIDDFRIYNKVLTNFEVNTLFTMGDNILLKKENNRLSFQVNNVPVYETPYVDNTWNHVVWNVANSSSTQGYVEINNGVKNSFNQIPLAPESRQFPPYPMTAYENTFFGYTYRACSFSFAGTGHDPWQAFDRSGTTRYASAANFTGSGGGVLNASTGASFGVDVNYFGVYLGIDMGQPIIIDYYKILQPNGFTNSAARRPKYWKIYATNNDACWIGGNTNGLNTGVAYDWVQIDVRYNETQYVDTTNFYVIKTIPYRYYVISANSLIANGDGGYFDISEWSIFGYNPTQIIQQYPPVAMTGFDTTYAGITYRACAYNYNNTESSAPWRAFDRSSAANANRYIGANSFDINGILNITGVSFGNDTSYNGVYLGIDMGQPFIMKYYHIIQYLYTRNPRNWKIYATNDSRCWNTTGGSFNTASFNTDAIYNWTQIDVRSQEISYTNLTRFILDSNNTPYRYYAFHVNALIGGTASGGFNFDIYEWQIFGFPYYSYKNRLGSVKNLGNVYLSDFNIHTTPLIPYDEDKIYGTIDLVNNSGTYTPDYTNSIIVPPGDIIPFTTTSWNTSNDLTVSGWFRTEGIQNGDVLFESIQNDIITATSDINNHVIPNNLTTVSFNYTSNIPIPQGVTNISFSTPGAIVAGGITDRSYPLLTTYSTSNTVSPLAIYAGNNINIIEPYMWYKFDSGALTVNDGTAKIDLAAIGTGGTVNTTTFVKGNASVYFANSTANYFRSSTPITNNVPLSIAFWFRIPAGNQNTYSTIGSYARTPYAAGNLSIQFDYQGSTAPANKLRVYTALDTQWNTQPTSTTSIAMDTWYHVVYTLDNSNPVNARLYINGVLESTATGSANKVLNSSSIGNFSIGASADLSRGFIGFLDDWRFYTFAMNISQVTELYRGRAIFYNTRSLRLWRNNNLLEFQTNDTSISTSAVTLNNTWNHVIWNVASSANTQGFVRINNGTKVNVSEFNTNMPLQRYPPASMTAPSTLFSNDIYGYNGGTYIASASSVYSVIDAAHNAVNYNNSSTTQANSWTCGNNGPYSSANGSYFGTVSTIVSDTTILGEWLQIQLPIPVILRNYNVYTWSVDANALLRGPKDFRIVGSTDGIIWTLVDSQTGITGYTSSGKSFTVFNNWRAYNYYRLIILSNNTDPNRYTSIQEWELNGFPLYPFKNTFGSITNKGKIWMSDFKILTNSIDTTMENQLYNTTPDDGSTKDTKLIYENIHITSNEIRVYNTDFVKTYPYLQYEFKDSNTLTVDSSSNLRILNNDGGTNLIDYGKNSLLLRNGDEAWFGSDDWNKNSNLTISTWFKTDGFKNGDEIIDFYQDPSTYIQVEQYVKYPKEAMTSDTFTSSSTGIVTRSKSTTYYDGAAYNIGRRPFNLFDTRIIDSDGGNFHTAINYTAATGIATTTYFPGYAGEGPLIDLGINIVLKQVRFYPRSLDRNPGIFRIYATNDTTKFDNLNYFGWDIIHDQTVGNRLTTTNYLYGQPTIVNINNNNSYRIYALVVNTLSGSGTTVLNFIEWELYGKEISITTPPILPVQISGGDYYYAFTNTNTVYDLNVLQDTTCDILVVGGGGGGSGRIGGGGGAGAVVYIPNATLPSGSYNISIGDGGISYSGGSENGQNTTITGNNISIIAQGGGGTFGGHDTANGKVGGSGGGAAGPNSALNQGGATGTGSSLGGLFGYIYGNRGGNITTARVGNPTSGTGGGGAGSAAVNINPSTQRGHGGNGILINITGNNYYWGGGGGGAGYGAMGGDGGIGGGGGGAGTGVTSVAIGGGSALNSGANGQAVAAGDGDAIGGKGGDNTGGGGGGGGWDAGIGGKGGSGIVIIRFHSGLKIAENSSNQLSLYMNNKSICDTTTIADNQWNHLMWNVINNGTPYGYVKLNNSQKIMTNIPGTTLTKYPRASANANTYVCADGTVVKISGSSVWTNSNDHNFYQSFNYSTSDVGWGSGVGTYVIASGLAVNTYRYDYAGEYLQIDLGETIILKNYNIFTRSSFAVRGPKDFRLYASNDANAWTNINHNSWVLLDTQSNLSAYTDFVAKSFTINNNNAYRFYVIITNKIFTSDTVGMVQIAELELYGYSAKTFYTTLNPIIWHQFNDTPDIFNSTPSLLYDNSTTNSTKFNMTVNSFFNDTTNLYFWYNFDVSSFTTNFGLAGSSYDLTNNNNIPSDTNDKVRGVSSANFTSAGIMSVPSYNFSTAFTSAITICYWVKISALDNYNTIFAGTSFNIAKDIASTGYNVNIFGLNIGTYNVGSPFLLDFKADNVWYHYAWVFQKSGTQVAVTVYKNGNSIPVYSHTGGTWTPPTSNFRFSSTDGAFLRGRLDDFRIYNKALSTNEISILASTSTNFFNDTRNLAAWYKFDDNSTSMLLDSSGNSYNLVNSGSATYDNANYKVGTGSLYLNGSSQYVSIPLSLNPYNIWYNNGISISFWFRYSATPAGTSYNLFSFGDGAVGTIGTNIFRAWLEPVNIIRSQIIINTSTNVFYDIPTAYTANSWCHYLWTVSTTGVWSFYINGVYINPVKTQLVPNTTWTRLYMGRGVWSTNDYPIGNIDDFRIYNRVLSQDEVSILYNGPNMALTINTLSAQTTNLLGLYTFESNTNLGLDTSGQGNNLTNYNVTIDTTNYKIGNSSIFFSSTNTTQYLMSSSTSIFAPNSSFTYALWVKVNTNNAYQDILSCSGLTTAPFGGFKFGIHNLNSVYMYILLWNNTSSSIALNYGFNNFVNNTWKHVAFSITYLSSSSQILNVYIDGVNMHTSTGFYYSGINSNLYIGRNQDTTNSNYLKNANVDDVRFWNRALSENEIKVIYNGGDMLAWYTFDNNNITADSSGNSRTLTNGGGMQAEPVLFARGNGSVYSSALTSTFNLSTTAITINNSFSISVWVRPTDLTANTQRYVISHGTASTTNNLLFIAFNNIVSTTNTLIRFGFTGNDLDTTAVNISTYLNKWTHIVVTFNWVTGGTRNIYVNGILSATNTSASTPTFGNNFRIGYSALTTNGFIGYIDDVRVYNKVLTAADVSILYRDNPLTLAKTTGYTTNNYLYQNAYLWNGSTALTIASTTTGLIAYYQFENFNDSTANARTLTGNVKSGSGATVPTVSNSINNQIYLLGTSSYQNISTNAWLTNASLNVTNISFTIAFWVRVTTTGSNQYFIIQPTVGAGTGSSLFLALNTTNNLHWSHYNDDTTTTSTHADMLNTWTHLAFTLDNTSRLRTIYKNGIPIHTFTGTTGSTNFAATSLRVGGATDTSTVWPSFIGFMDELRIYNKVLSQDEIISIYNNSNFLTVANDNTYLSFNGHVSYIQSLLNLFHNTNGFSMHFVFRTSNITSTSQILYIGNNTTDLIRVFITNNTLTFKVGFATQATCAILANTTYIVDLTALWTVAKDNMILKIFINGLNASTTSGLYNNTFLNVSTTGLSYYFGKAASDSTNDATPIWIQDFRMFHYPLSEPEIAALQTGAVAYNNDGLYPGYYINKLGSIANLGDLYLSDFRIITEPMTPALEDIIYNNKPEYYSIVDEDTVANTIQNMNALYFNGSKKLETNATGINVKGNIAATGGVLSFYSDERLKTVVSGIDNPVEKLMKINAFKYVPNDLAKSLGIYNTNTTEVGVSAQDVNEILPEVVSLAACDREILDNGQTVSKSGENYLTVSYQRMVPLLIECIKELSDEIDDMENI
jgi:hypothetical protein